MNRPIIKCTKNNPYTPERDIPNCRVKHESVEEIGEQINGWPGGDIVTYRCKICGVEWTEELPQ